MLSKDVSQSRGRNRRPVSVAKSTRQLKASTVIAFVVLLIWTSGPALMENFKARAATASGFPYSTPITLNNAGTQLWVVNPDPDNNSVTVIDVTDDSGRVLAEIPAGNEPNSVAINDDDSRAYVANTVSGTVSVINTSTFAVVDTIRVGVEPRALCFTPNFSKLYVACSSSNDIHVINPDDNRVTRIIENPSFSNLFAMTITNDGDSEDNDELLYVTNLYAEYVPGSDPKPADDVGKEGIVGVVNVGSDSFIDRVKLKSVETAFRSNGRSRNASGDGIAPDPNPATFTVPTSAFPNLLTSIAGTRQNGTNMIYTFSLGSSPTGPVRFNVNIQGLVSLIKGLEDAGQTRNLNDEIRLESADPFPEGVPRHRFTTLPWGMAFYHNSYKALGVSSACDYVVVMDFDENGKATIIPDGPNNIRRMLTGTRRDPDPDRAIFLDGKAPRGVVINRSDTRAYTFNYVSRDVTVIDLANNRAIATVETTASKGDPVVQLGKELFNSAIGPIDTSNRRADGSVDPREGAMSDFGWVSCATCHLNGLTDGVAWAFPAGPRISTSMDGTFTKSTGGPVIQRALNWSAIFDELEDFELNTRGVAGGRGLITLLDGSADPNVVAFALPNHGRDARRDAITEYVKTIRPPIAPEDDDNGKVRSGRNLFKKVGCADCHDTALWTRSRVEFAPPPPTNEIENGQLRGQLQNVGTFDPARPHEVRGTGAVINQTALGATGFNTPSLLGVHSREKFLLHDGSVTSFEQLFDNPAHVGDHPKLRKSGIRKKIIKFLRSIDSGSAPFN